MNDFNEVIALLLGEHPDRMATSGSLAAQIAARDLWRCPEGRNHPEPWHIETWVRSEWARGRFALQQGRIAFGGAMAAAAEGWRRTG